MELTTASGPLSRQGGRATRAAALSPGRALAALLALVVAVLLATHGLHDVAQRSLNGLVSGSYLALGAIGLTLAYGILKLVNFAHGDLLTFGAYVAFLGSVTIGLPLVVAAAAAICATAGLMLAADRVVWRPMRRKGAGMLQLLVTTIGIAFLVRYGIQMVAGSKLRTLDIATVDAIEVLGLRIGVTQLVVLVIGIAVIVTVAAILKYTLLGKQMRALADNFQLAATTGIDTGRLVTATWALSAGLAGLAGVLVVAATGTVNPSTGFFLLLPIFAATILGSIGNAYGALVGGLVIGLSQEWATLVIDPRWKISVSFVILILVLLIRPQGIFGRKERIG